MEINELLRKLEPILGANECKNWWIAFLAEDAKGKQQILQYLQLKATETIQLDYTTQVLFPPPPEQVAKKGTYNIGTVLYGNKKLYDFFLQEKEWLSHIAIVGRSGSGKTNACFHLIDQLIKHNKPFWIFDFKRNYRDLLEQHKELLIYTVGRDVANLDMFNPLIPINSPHNHIRLVVALLCKTFFLGEGAHSLLVKCIDNLYKNFGVYSEAVDKYPTFRNVQQWLESYTTKSRESQWLQSTMRAIKMLNFGTMGKALNTQKLLQLENLLNKKVIFEVDAISQHDKKFLIALLLEYRHKHKLSNPNREKLQDVLIIEEAHHLLPRKKLGEEEGVLEKLLREERELGTSIIIIDQLASKLSDVAFANTSTTIALNQKHHSDINTIGNAVILNDEERKHLSKLPVGMAVMRQQERWPKPVLIQIPHYPVNKGKITDNDVKEHMNKRRKLDVQTTKKETLIDYPLLNENEIMFLQSTQNNPIHTTIQHYKNCNLSNATGNTIKKKLIEKQLLQETEIRDKKGKKNLLNSTKKGTFYLRLQTQQQEIFQSCGSEHQYYQQRIFEELEKAGHTVEKETQLKTCRPDILVNKEVVIEIETGKSKHWFKHIITHLQENRKIIIAVTNKTAHNTILSELKKHQLYPHKDLRIIIPRI
ncbi:hypothetical protein COV18_02665 [Candidatus Woesearchaeota archaeon CG10_big_fil_rev_8_21_14_0_10_37_12]|nr:MAG: hypothetical protein COV18_02665 [Candidatus Woesearchaeota archaeon CG10_big_fil_rev_8_21_14_0_10_37_12]